MRIKVLPTLKEYFTRREPIPLGARRVFRVSACTSLSLVIAYCIAMPFPYFAAMIALMLSLKPGPPITGKALLTLVLITFLTTGMGLLLIPLLIYYAIPALCIIALVIYFSNYKTLNTPKALIGTFFTLGFTVIPLAGLMGFSISVTVIQSFATSMIIAVFCQWCIYPIFPEDKINPLPFAPPSKALNTESHWAAIKTSFILMPAYIFALTNPHFYLPIIMKVVFLGQQGSTIETKKAGKELLGSTFLAGICAIAIWFLLHIITSLWIYASGLFIFCVYFIGKFYGVFKTKWTPFFWQNTAVTMIILLGPTVEDSANGKDVYKAFAIRLALFIAVTVYAVIAIYFLEYLRTRNKLKLSHNKAE